MLGKLKKLKRIRKHGFRSRSVSVIKSRRTKGRKRLAVTVHSK